MDEIEQKQKFESDIRPLLVLNLIITCIPVLPLLLISPFWLFWGLLFYNYKYFNAHDFWFQGIVFGIPMIVWIISIILSIQCLKQKELGKIQTTYLIFSFSLIVIIFFLFIFAY
jgi:hypothetical protein